MRVLARLPGLCSLVLAVLLQALPLARLGIQSVFPASAWAYVFRLGAVSVAVFAGVDAVSGASVAITQPYSVSATVGQPYSRRLTTSGHAALSWSANPSAVAPGLALNRSGTISGTPTQAGTFTAAITAWEKANLTGDKVTTTFTFNIAAAPSPPVITTPPTNQIAPAGSNVTFTVVATGPNPTYRWRFMGTNLSATNAFLTLTNAKVGQSGLYSVVVTNAAGSVASPDARLLVVPVPGPQMRPFLSPQLGNGGISFVITTAPGYRYEVQRSPSLTGSNWVTLTNLPSSFNPATNMVSFPTNVPEQFFRVRVVQ